MSLFRVIALATVLLASAAAPALAGSSPTLKVVTLRSGGVGVEGRGWRQRSVTVTLYTGQWLVGLSVQPNASGRFRLAAVGANLCARVLFRAYDAHGHAKQARGPELGCASPANYPRPTLRAIVGHAVTLQTVRILATHPASITLHLGDELYLWEPGTTVPAFSPTLQEAPAPVATVVRLVLVDQGQTPARACAQVDCAAGFYWRFLAAATGDTGIVLSAACRQSKPPCMVPDFLITVHIVS